LNPIKKHYRNAVYETPSTNVPPPLEQASTCGHRWKDYNRLGRVLQRGARSSRDPQRLAVFDLSPMTKHRITGPDALAFLDRLLTRDVSKTNPDKVGYAIWCDDNGRVIDDGNRLSNLKPGDYRLCRRSASSSG